MTVCSALSGTGCGFSCITRDCINVGLLCFYQCSDIAKKMIRRMCLLSYLLNPCIPLICQRRLHRCCLTTNRSIQTMQWIDTVLSKLAK